MERGGRQHHVRKTQRVPSAVLTGCAMRNLILSSISRRMNHVGTPVLGSSSAPLLAFGMPSACNLGGAVGVTDFRNHQCPSWGKRVDLAVSRALPVYPR